MVKSYTLQPEKTEQSDRLPKDLLFYIVASIFLHAIILFGVDYWMQVFKPNRERELSQPIPIEYLEVPPEPAKTPPVTLKRAARDSVNGGKVKQKSSISVKKSASPAESKPPAVRPQTLPEPKPATVSPPKQPTQQPAISPNSSSQQAQSQASKTVTPPVTQPTEPKIAQSEIPAKTSSEPQLPQIEETPAVVPPTDVPQPTQTPGDTTALTNQLRQSTVARRLRTLPTPKPQPTQTPSDTTALTNKLRQSTVARRIRTLSTPKPQPTNTPSDTTALTNNLRQSTVAPRVRTLPTPKPQPTQTPSAIPSQPKPQQTTIARSTASSNSKPNQTNVAPADQPTNRTQKLAASPSSRQLQPRSIQSTPPRVKPSRTSGAASRLGGPVSLSSRNIQESLAALPHSNPSNRALDGIDARKDDLGPYLEQLQRQVKQQWIPGLTQSSRRTVLYFTISRSGQVSGLQVARPSGFDAIDEAALSAVQRAAPFAPLPTTYSENYLSIEFTFSINVYGQLDLFMGQ
ncbi:TonB family protein [Scytonema sp. UIC 10036]|uniref:energy transducer TonB n=1 Tax=Scytonema sp. UIC 10036 TaxID=2304196 RepID=UPI0012DAB0E8|nr:energy transducer TonB [Scytonema sp. UIC 10036]MUG91655.1 TonB family protein [Scytonema sp. UIC 10036]